MGQAFCTFRMKNEKKYRQIITDNPSLFYGIWWQTDVNFLFCKEKGEDVQEMSLTVQGQLPADKTRSDELPPILSSIVSSIP